MKIYTKGNVEITENITKYHKIARLQPKGFWTNVIEIYHTTRIEDGKWDEPEITWSSGGGESDFDEIEKVNNFIEALGYAKEFYNRWKNE